MASCIFRGARGGAVALLGLCGLIFSCSSGTGTGASARAATPSSHADVKDNFGLSDLEQRFEEISRKVAPAVVAISATDAKLEADEALRSDHINPQKLQTILEAVDRTVGTGFVVDPEGYIVTNDHVVSACDHLWVTTDDHRVFPAIIVGSDPRADLAVLKIPASHLPTIHFADAQVHRGQWSIALGNPYGLATGGEMAVSVGVVSAVGRSLPKLSSKEDRLYTNLIQTTTQINPGNSGGPLFDLHGDVIGINAAVILPQKMTNGIGFAIPITTHLRKAIEDLKNGREVAYGWLGVRVSSPTPADRRELGVAEDLGARIDSVEINSPAATAKLFAGDLVTKFNGQVIHDGDQLVRLVGEAPTDQNVGAIVYRNKKPTLISLRIGKRPSPPALVTRETQRFRWRGMVLGPIPKYWSFGDGATPKEGLMVIAVDAKSRAAKEGIMQGSVIKSIAGKHVSDIVQLQTVLNTTAPDAAIEAINPGQVASARD